MIRSFLPVVGLLLIGCPQMMMPAFLDVTATPRSITPDGAMTEVKVRATDEAGNVGSGQVRIRSAAGSLRDGVTLPLDAFGTAVTLFSCDAAEDADCTGTIRLTTDWARSGMVVSADVSVRISDGSTGGGAGGGSGGGTAMSEQLMIGTTDGTSAYGLGPMISGPTDRIRLGLTDPAINESGSSYERIFMTATGDLVYFRRGTMTNAFRRFRADGVDEALVTPGCTDLNATRLYDSPEGLLYSCPINGNPRTGVLLNKVSDGMPHPLASASIVWNRDNSALESIGRESALFYSGGNNLIVRTGTFEELRPPNLPGRCESVLAVSSQFLCYSQGSLFRISATTVTNHGPYATPPANFPVPTLGNIRTLSAFGTLGTLFLTHTSGNRQAMVSYPPRSNPTAPSAPPPSLLVDSMNAMPPSGTQRTWHGDFRPVGRAMY